MTPTATPTTSLGEFIEAKRMSLGLTKSEAARRAGVSRGTWHEVEAGRRTNLLANTLNLFDEALELPRGTLHRMARPAAGRPDLVVTDMTTMPLTMVEFKSSQQWQPPDPSQLTIDNGTAYRRRLVSLAATLTVDQVREAVHLIEGAGRDRRPAQRATPVAQLHRPRSGAC